MEVPTETNEIRLTDSSGGGSSPGKGSSGKPAKKSRPDTSSEVVIETRNLSKVYRDFWGRQKVRALKALDLET